MMAKKGMVFLMLMLIVSLLNGTTYYVAPWGDDDSLGTFSAPWRTINKAATTMVASDSVLIRGGNYEESVNPANSGTASDPITYANYGSEEVIVEGGEQISGWVQDSGNRYYASVGFTPSPRFSSSRDPAGNLGGLVLQAGAKMRYAMSPSFADVDSPGEYYMNDSAGMGPPYTLYVYARDLGGGYDPNNYQMIIGRRRKGFDLDGGEDYQIVDGLTFRDYNDNAIHSIGSNYCEFKNLTLYSSFITGIYLTSYSRNCIIEKCLFWDNGHGGIELARSHSTTVKRCKFTAIDLGDGLGGNGAHMWLGPVSLDADSCIIENNIGFRTGSDYIFGPFFAMRGSYNIVRHNSALYFGMAGIAMLDGGNNTVINNAIDCNTGVACINVFGNAVADSGHFIEYNDFYAADPIGKYRWDGVSYDNLSAWEAASGQSNNIDSVPGFADPDSEDLHLVSASTCIDAGTSTNASSEDYDGNPRPQGAGYDIGAFEYLPGSVEDVPYFSHGRDLVTVQPNPATRLVRIKRRDARSDGEVRIFDLSGRLVTEMKFSRGKKTVTWDGKDLHGANTPSGTYFLIYTVDYAPYAERKLMLLR
jgi:parallel beta-helix repeat protein